MARNHTLLRMVVAAVLATAVVGTAAAARADDYGHDRHHGHDYGRRYPPQPYPGYYQPGYYAYGPPPPPVVYAPPQPVYAPPVAPALSLFFNFR